MAEEATSREPAGLEELVPEKESIFPGVINEDSYLYINDNAPCFVDKDSYDNNKTQVGESPPTEDKDEDSNLMVTHAVARHSVELL